MMVVADVAEGDGMASVVVSLDIAVQDGFMVAASTTAATATVGADYTAVTDQALTFAGTAGESQTFTIAITDDAVAENAETLMVSLASLQGTGATVDLPDAATITIADNDSAVLMIAVADVTEDGGMASVVVSLDIAVQGSFTVVASTTDGTATATATATTGADYTAVTSQTLAFAGTASESQTFTIAIINDAVAENAETLTVSLASLQGTSVAVGLPAAATVIIIDDDNTAVLTMANVGVTEDVGTASVIVTVDNTVPGGFEVNAATADGTATAGADYTAVTSQTLTFAGIAGETRTFMVTITDDAVTEGAETFMASLSLPVLTGSDTSLTVGLPVAATVTITDNDSAALTLTMTDVTVNEGDGTASVSVSLNTAVQGGFTVAALTADGTATEGADYTAVTSQILTFDGTPGETQTATITITDDSVAEGNETLMVSLSDLQTSGRAVMLPAGTATVTIMDNDSAALTMKDVDVTEGDGTATVATVTVSLDIAVQGGFAVDVATADGTAMAVDDYTAITGHTLTFAGTADEVQSFTVTITADDVAENAETLVVSLGNLQDTSAMVGLLAEATVIITDDDNDAVLTMESVEVTEADGTASVIVSLDKEVSGGFTVNAATADGTATAGDDYTAVTSQTLTFSGTASETKTFTVTITDDAIAEVTETLMVSLSSLQVTGATVGLPIEATVTITDDEIAALTMADANVNEGGTATVTVSLDYAVPGGFTVDARTRDGTATAGQDYTAVTGETLTFDGTAGETQIFTVSITNDAVTEADETLTVSLTNLQGTAVPVDSSATATVTITNDLRFVVTTINNQTYLSGEPITALTLPRAGGGIGALNYTLTPAVADIAMGLIFDPATGILSGTPTGIVTQTVTYTVTDSADPPVSTALTFTVMVVVEITVDPTNTTDTTEIMLNLNGNAVEDGIEDGILILPASHDVAKVTISAPPRLAIAGPPAGVIFSLMTDIALDQADGTPVTTLTTTLCLPTIGVPGSRTRAVYHYTAPNWSDIDRGDTRPGLICGITTTFSPFAVGYASAVSTVTRLNEQILSRASQVIIAGTLAAVARRVETIGEDTRGGSPPPSAPVVQLGGQSSLHGLLSAHGQAVMGDREYERLLDGASFVLPLSAGEDGYDTASGGAGGLSMWGNSEYSNLDSGGTIDDIDWGGDILSLRFGIDRPMDEDKLVGVALSWNRGSFDYENEENGVRGDYQYHTTNLNPYFGWALHEGMRVWGLAGYGQGEIRIRDADTPGNLADSATDHFSLAGGFKGKLLSFDSPLCYGSSTTLALKGDAALSRVAVDEYEVDGEDVAAQNVGSHRLRLLVEGEQRLNLCNGWVLTEMLEVGVRYDGGDGISGGGIELGGGLNYSYPLLDLTFDGNVRMLVGNKYEEWGVDFSVQLLPPSGRGLFIGVRPAWGRQQSMADRLWNADVGELSGEDMVLQHSVDTEVGYGVAVSVMGASGVLTPFAGMTAEEGGSNRLRLGGRFSEGRGLSVSLEGEQDNTADGASHTVLLHGEITF